MASATTLLPDSTALLAEGPDALAFLQSQLANDVRGLDDGQWQWNCYLTPQGRVQSVFPLLRVAEARFVLVPPGGLCEAVRERLQRYRLRSKLELRVATEWRVQGELGASADAAPGSETGPWGMDVPGQRRLLVSNAGPDEPNPEALAEWRRADVAHGIPVVSAAVTDAFTPQALSLGRLAAYSVKKGCYPGQEIVARTHFLGRSKRSLARFEGESDAMPAPSAELVSTATGELAGVVISAAAKAGRGFALLAVVREGLGPLRLAGTSGASLESLPFAS
jgi:hypothetical protein